MAIEKNIIEQLRSLSPEKQRAVLDFIQSMASATIPQSNEIEGKPVISQPPLLSIPSWIPETRITRDLAYDE